MSPIRKEDDFRSQAIDDWDDWIEKEIRDAMERGEFANLPGHGKPIRIESNPFDPGMDMAYSRLRNAGYAPTWMQLDREITAGRAELELFLQRSGEYFAAARAWIDDHNAASHSRETPEAVPSRPWWAFWRRLREWLDVTSGPTARKVDSLTITDLEHIRNRMRTQYLKHAAELDKKIGTFHAALPPALWHLQRTALPKARAARLFDAHIPLPSR